MCHTTAIHDCHSHHRSQPLWLMRQPQLLCWWVWEWTPHCRGPHTAVTEITDCTCLLEIGKWTGIIKLGGKAANHYANRAGLYNQPYSKNITPNDIMCLSIKGEGCVRSRGMKKNLSTTTGCLPWHSAQRGELQYAAMRMVAGSRPVLVIAWDWHIG